MEESIFTKIINGEINGQVIYEDDSSAALLTIEPLTDGHMLIVPKKPAGTLWDLDDVNYHHLWSVARKMATLLRETYPRYERIGTIVEGFGVPDHAHIHLFGYEQPINETIIDHAKARRHASAAELARVADELRSA